MRGEGVGLNTAPGCGSEVGVPIPSAAVVGLWISPAIHTLSVECTGVALRVNLVQGSTRLPVQPVDQRGGRPVVHFPRLHLAPYGLAW